MEGDLRFGVLHHLLQVPSEPGLSDVLHDGLDVEQVVIQTTVPNLDFIPKGRPTNNPSELFLSGAADLFLNRLSKSYDYVIIDSVPVLVADDTTSLAPKVEGIVFVVRGGFTSIPLARRALELLRRRQGCVLGVVCNRGAGHLMHYGSEEVPPLGRETNGRPAPVAGAHRNGQSRVE